MATSQRKAPVPLLQAAQESPGLARLCALADESSERLRSIAPLLPSTLRACVRPGPIDGPQWCLVIDNAAAAAKIRQLVPALEAHLRSRGWDVTSIRLKVRMHRH